MSRFVQATEKFLWKLRWDLDLDISDTSTDLRLPAETRFGGTWRLVVRVTSPQNLAFALEWEGVELGAVGRSAKPYAYVGPRDAAGILNVIAKSELGYFPTFPSASSSKLDFAVTAAQFADAGSPIFSPTSFRSFYAEVNFPLMGRSAAETQVIPRYELARYLAPSYASQQVNDIRLIFPHCAAELWASSAVLCAASPYFATLLGSDTFLENIEKQQEQLGGSQEEGMEVEKADEPSSEVVVVDRQRRSASSLGAVTESLMRSEDGGPDLDDSDDETDDLLVRDGQNPVATSKRPTYREIKIAETAYSTYRAVLLYLQTSHISFAPLTSSLLPHIGAAEETRAEFMTKTFSQDSALPLPVSPKSVYRLAHILELPRLMALALDNLKCQLTVDNAARELFSDTSALYDEVRKLVMDYVVDHRSEVKASQAMKDVEQMTKAGQLPRAGAVLWEVMARVSP